MNKNIITAGILLVSLVVIYFSRRQRKGNRKNKSLWLLLEILGILGLIYSASLLIIIGSFKGCCGF